MITFPYAAQRHLFKAYDIRGDRAYFTRDFMQALSQVIAMTYRLNSAKTVVIGYDARHGSLTMAHSLAQTIIRQGIKVIWLGLVTTPIMAFWAEEYEGHGIIATASHSEGHINGLKWLINGTSPSSQDIQKLYRSLMMHKEATQSIYSNSKLVEEEPETISLSELSQSSLCTLLSEKITTDHYCEKVFQALSTINKPKVQTNTKSSGQCYPLTIVIDCLNGSTGPFVKPFFSQFSEICAQVHILNAEPNGNFPKGNPDPTESGRLKELQAAVVSHSADIGLGFDGDGDRLTVVDNQGNIVMPDHLICLLAQVAIETHALTSPKATNTQDNDELPTTSTSEVPAIIFDVKCSHHLPIMIQQLGARPQISQTGSSIMRRALQTGGSNAIFAGELSGHFLFNDGHFVMHDDAMYAALRLLNHLSQQDASLTDIINQLPVMVNTPDVYLPLKSNKLNNNKDRPILTKLANLCQRLQTCCSPNLNQALDHLVVKKPSASSLVLNHANATTATTYHHQTNLSGKPLSHAENLGLPLHTRLTCIDGIRLDFDDGFGVIRPSNTSHSLTVRFAGNSLDDLNAVQKRFVSLFELVDHDLACQIAKISPSS